jgi:RHS repeat-associated protein
MYYLRARWYEPSKGRFWTADKWEPSAAKPCCFANNELRLEELFSLAHHLYAYAVSDPVNNVDPTGERAMSRTLSLGWTLIALGVRLERAWPTIRNIGAGSAAFLCATAVILKRSNVQVPPPVRDPIEAICDALDIFDVF